MARRPRIELAGATALVTGAGRGIGEATALALAGSGCRVVCVDLDLETAEKTAARCAEVGPPADAHRCDVADADAVEGLAARVHETHGPLGVLVANAGVGLTGRFLDVSLDDWRWIRGVNLDGVVHTCRSFGPVMVGQGRGHVAIVSSGLGYTPRATESAYVTTKAAVLALARSLRSDWRTEGVGVSAICPGVIDTPIIDHTRFRGDQADPKRRERTTKVFRRGHKPEKVAAAIVDAVRHDRAVVPVGWEARLGWWLHRWGPIPVQQVVAGHDPR